MRRRFLSPQLKEVKLLKDLDGRKTRTGLKKLSSMLLPLKVLCDVVGNRQR